MHNNTVGVDNSGIGLMTNDPTWDWHLQNLNNYAALQPGWHVILHGVCGGGGVLEGLEVAVLLYCLPPCPGVVGGSQLCPVYHLGDALYLRMYAEVRNAMVMTSSHSSGTAVQQTMKAFGGKSRLKRRILGRTMRTTQTRRWSRSQLGTPTTCLGCPATGACIVATLPLLFLVFLVLGF